MRELTTIERQEISDGLFPVVAAVVLAVKSSLVFFIVIFFVGGYFYGKDRALRDNVHILAHNPAQAQLE